MHRVPATSPELSVGSFMAAALIDRLLHHCHIVNIRGNSYRMREHQALLRPGSEESREGDRSCPLADQRRFSTNRRLDASTESESVQFSIAKSAQFSVAIDSTL